MVVGSGVWSLEFRLKEFIVVGLGLRVYGV
jgi:hypothetical protein